MKRKLLLKNAVLAACVMFVTHVFAQAPVEEHSTGASSADAGTSSRDLRDPFEPVPRPADLPSSFGTEQRGFEDPAANPGNSSEVPTGTNAQLFYQLQILQEEVRELRGLVEEQAYQLNRLAREQKDQYLDMDRRISQQSSSAANFDTGSSESPVETSSTDPEIKAYSRAFALTREKRFQEAIDGFNTLIIDFPSGAMTGYAFYWLGELYLALPEPELEKSRQSFVQVVSLYPDHQKMPDTLYKLGVVYHRLDDLLRARQYFNQVISEHAGSGAARLAQTYLSELP